MRPMRFRVWNKKTEQMQWPVVIYNHMGYGETNPPLTGTYEGPYLYETCPPTDGVIVDYIIMQSTGLKDKNGEEIYEMDIINTNYQKLWKVIWNNKMASFVVCEQIDQEDCEETKEHLHGSLGAIGFIGSEIIGNFYEKPELLTQNNDDHSHGKMA